MKSRKQQIAIFSVFFTLTVTIGYATNLLISNYKLLAIQDSPRYDSKLDGPNVSWMGPLIGEVIPLARLTDSAGKNVRREVMRDRLFLLVVNPGCEVCESTTDQMRAIERFAGYNSIGFAVVSFKKDLPLSSLHAFSVSAGLSANQYLFDGYETDLSPNSRGLQYPAYILTDTNGQILRILAGSHENPEVRETMTEQIMADTKLDLPAD